MNPEANPDEELLEAARAGDEAAVRRALKAGADPNFADAGGRTPLMEASLRSRVDIMRPLLEAGADPNLSTAFGETALIFACSGRGRDTVPLLLQHHADPKKADRDKKTPLMWIVDLQFHRGGVPVDVIAPLVAAGAEPNARDKFCQTALMWAVKGDAPFTVRPAVLKELLRNGVDVHIRDEQGETALFALVRFIDDVVDIDVGKDCIDVLVGAGADRNARNGEGKTPLGIVNRNNPTVIEFLKDLGFEE